MIQRHSFHTLQPASLTADTLTGTAWHDTDTCPTQTQNYNWSSRFTQTSFCPFSQSLGLSKYYLRLSHHFSRGSPTLCFSDLPYFLRSWQFWGLRGRYAVKCPSISLRLWIWGGRPQVWSAILITPYQEYLPSHQSDLPLMLTLITCLRSPVNVKLHF